MLNSIISFTLVLLLVSSCSDGDNGADGLPGVAGLNGSDGANFYSYVERGSLQEIVGDGVREEFEASPADFYILPRSFEVMVDNPHSGCDLRDFRVVFKTDLEDVIYTFQATENRYYMEHKDGPLGKVVDSSTLKVYYESQPEVDCGDAIYRLHSGVTFEVRVIERLGLEE